MEQSKAINRLKEPAIIMATNGMCTAGRIKHHLAQYIDRAECSIVFVGYQARGTLGRQIVEGQEESASTAGSGWSARVEQISGFFGACRPCGCWAGCGTSPPRPSNSSSRTAKSSRPDRWPTRSATELNWNVTVPQYEQVANLE